MLRVKSGLLLVLMGTGASAADTNWGIRELGKPPPSSNGASASTGNTSAGKPSSKSLDPPPAGTWAMSSGTPSATSSAIASGSGSGRPVDMGAIRLLGSHWGQVTSTYRSVEHNRRVGGVPNSYHLSGRAIDIARRAGVSHSQIAAAYRNPGYALAESLDEVGFGSVVALLATYAGCGPELKPWLRDAQINRDRNLRLQYLAGMGRPSRQEALIHEQMLAYRTFPVGLFVASDVYRDAIRAWMGSPR